MIPNRRHNPRTSRRSRRPFKHFMQAAFRWLWWVTGNRRRSPQAGFVFPTTLLLLLMVTLTATALTYRTFSRSNQAIVQRQQQVIYNAATPAIDRAKSKLEFVFQSDNRFPSGLPPSDQLANLMLQEGNWIANATVLGIANLGLDPATDDPYSLPGETRVDINDDGELDNAWMFQTDEDLDGDGQGEYVVYSILVDHQGPRELDTVDISNPNEQTKANALVTRTGPLATTEATPACQGARSEGGWQSVTSANAASLHKNFQVNALVVRSRDFDNGTVNPVVETLEFQQSRIAANANNWGAWFRYDLEIHPGPDFNWNGAMHTDGNLILEKADADGITPYMVSSFNSCVYSQASSEITLGEFDSDGTSGLDLTYGAGAVGDFQGQAIAAKIGDDAYMGGGENVVMHVFNGDGVAPEQENFNTGTDSVDNNGGRPSDVAMNPLVLFTQGRESHNSPQQWDRDADWATGVFTQAGEERVRNAPTARPFVDDFFRADDRWGPSPRYDSTDTNLDVTLVDSGAGADPQYPTIGDDIDQTDGVIAAGVEETLSNNIEGLDGYWERQSINRGLRIIVGQRLELGNANGWNADPTNGSVADVNVNGAGDPLYPPKALHQDLDNINTADFGTPTFDPTNLDGDNAAAQVGGNHQYLQRRSLRDNLAAVQGMVAYHYEINSGQFPAACMALTAHPGTPQSIINSRTFNYYPAGTNVLKADFLNGEGTNGWEFRFPDAFDTDAEFGAELDKGDALGDALRNWAYFSGDPNGGAPSFKPLQDGNVHPYPYMSMWGDVSPLRRIFDDYLDAATPTAYADLSFADKATLHSAACTISLLAYNVDTAVDQYALIAAEDLTDIGTELWELIKSVDSLGNSSGDDMSSYVGDTYDTFAVDHPIYPGGQPVVLTPNILTRDASDGAAWVDPNHTGTTGNTCFDPANPDTDGFEDGCDESDYYSQFSPEDFIRAYVDRIGLTAASPAADVAAVEADIDRLRAFIGSYQIFRDRALGFNPDPYAPAFAALPQPVDPSNTWDPATLIASPATGTYANVPYSSSCNPDIFTNIGTTSPGIGPRKVALATVLCSTQLDVRYPSLYYLFPVVAHDHGGSNTGGYDHTQPVAEEYIADTYVAANSSNFAVLADADITSIAAEPGLVTAADWVLPTATNGAGLADPDLVAESFRVQTPAGTGIDVAMLDKGMYDSRELLSVRVLDIDINKLTGTTAGTDRWLSSDLENQAQGIVYAFREDAVREDEIVRPTNSTVATCQALNRAEHPRLFAIERDATCYMEAQPLASITQPPAYGTASIAYSPQDPPLTDELISFKPVDFIPDPERRPYGFRLRTGDGSSADFSNGDRDVGMTLVTDNSLYILGDFNVHSTDGTTASLLEEFTDTILPDGFAFGDFYGDRTKAELDLDNFANLAVDHWRPVELLSDAISIVSGDFIDGAISDTFTEDENSVASSYTNQPRPLHDGSEVWQRENPGEVNSPVFVDRNGTYYYVATPVRPFYQRYDTADEWRAIDEEIGLQAASDTYVNATFVSGIVPSRPRQAYGGLHNYPRFLEDWGAGASKEDLYIQGAFIQLNFSTASTGPQDQDALEPGAVPITDEVIDFYVAPNRFFGFDVALLYVPPAPAAERFVDITSPRSEYYREVASDDPYTTNLKCAKNAGGTEMFPQLCP